MQIFSIGECIRYGWETFKKRPWFFVGATVITGLLSTISSSIAQGTWDLHSPPLVIAAANIGDFFVQCLIYMGLYKLSLKAIDSAEHLSFTDLWTPQHLGSFAFTTIVYGLMVFVGFILFIIPGVILMLTFFFPFYPIVDRGLGPWQALTYSKRITYGHRWQLLLFFLTCILLILAGALALLIGLFIVLPVTALATARVYRVLEQETRVSSMT